MAPGRDWASLVRAAQAGDDDAFRIIYERFADPLFRFLYAQSGDAGLAEEISGDLWMRVVERLPEFRFPRGDPDAAFVAWLYRIARNLVIDTFRRRSSSNLPLEESLVSRTVSVEEQLVAADEQNKLREAMQTLTAEQREVVLLRFVEELSTSEVAAITERSEGAVKALQHRALGALARALGGHRGKKG